jgi:D-glycero-beta-D-manno-heptose 1-phosphate adenylyltransferase
LSRGRESVHTPSIALEPPGYPAVAINRKIEESMGRLFTRDTLLAQRERWRADGKTVVLTNGCYDILHPGHIRTLEQARSFGDVLILALNSDESVRRSKGPSRPFFDQGTRAELACHLEAVDAVVLFDEDTPRETIAEILPDVLVKGADWTHFVAGREEVEAAGGVVKLIQMEPGFSTTDIGRTVMERHGHHSQPAAIQS